MTIAIDINDVLRNYTGQFINVYKKFIDPTFDKSVEDITSFDLAEEFDFTNGHDEMIDYESFNKFKFEDYPFEIFGRANTMGENSNLCPILNRWLQNTLQNFETEKIPNIIIVSPFEYGISIQSTLYFLSQIGIRAREFYFPIDSMTIWDKCDILITANPNLLNNMPEGKIGIKIKAPYNKEAKSTYTFDSLSDLIEDENNTIVKLIEEK